MAQKEEPIALRPHRDVKRAEVAGEGEVTSGPGGAIVDMMVYLYETRPISES